MWLATRETRFGKISPLYQNFRSLWPYFESIFGLVVIGGDSCSEGRGFESGHRILDGHFSHQFVVKLD